MNLHKIIFPFTLISATFFAVSSVIYYFNGRSGYSVLYAITSVYSIVSYYYYLKTKNEKVVKIAAGLLSIPILIPSQIFGGMFGIDIFLLYIYITWAFFILGKKLGLYYSLFVIFASVLILIFQLLGYVEYFYNTKTIIFFYFTYLIQVLISYLYQNSKEILEIDLEKNNETLLLQKDKLELEINNKKESELRLKDYTGDLEDVKKATLNILEDLNIEKNEIAKSKANVDAILSSIADGLVAINNSGVVLFANGSAGDLLGYKEEDLVGKKWTEAVLINGVDGSNVEDIQSPYSISIAQNKKVSGRYNYQTKNGRQLPVSISVSPIIISGQTIGVIEAFRDITKEIEIDKAKNEFISIASHELRTPMTAIKGYVSMLLDGDYGKLPESVNQPLKDISQSTQRLISLVNDLLNISRIEAGRLKIATETFDLKQLVDDTLNSLMPIAMDHKIEMASSLESVNVSADKSISAQILNNLIGNSLKFTEKGSINVTSEINGELVKVFIADTGIGISPNDQIKLFGKFNQIEDSNRGHIQGTGLGLYISKSAANKMGGDVWIEKSEIGKGSTFAFSLPLSDTSLANKIKTQIEKDSLENPDKKQIS